MKKYVMGTSRKYNTLQRRKASWIYHTLLWNRLLKHDIELKTAVGRRRRRRKQLLDNLRENRIKWNLREEELDGTRGRRSFGKSYGPVARQTT